MYSPPSSPASPSSPHINEILTTFPDLVSVLFGKDAEMTESKLQQMTNEERQTACSRAFRRRSRHAHPDLNQHDPRATDAFKNLNRANEVLSNDNLSQRYFNSSPKSNDLSSTSSVSASSSSSQKQKRYENFCKQEQMYGDSNVSPFFGGGEAPIWVVIPVSIIIVIGAVMTSFVGMFYKEIDRSYERLKMISASSKSFSFFPFSFFSKKKSEGEKEEQEKGSSSSVWKETLYPLVFFFGVTILLMIILNFFIMRFDVTRDFRSIVREENNRKKSLFFDSNGENILDDIKKQLIPEGVRSCTLQKLYEREEESCGRFFPSSSTKKTNNENENENNNNNNPLYVHFDVDLKSCYYSSATTTQSKTKQKYLLNTFSPFSSELFFENNNNNNNKNNFSNYFNETFVNKEIFGLTANVYQKSWKSFVQEQFEKRVIKMKDRTEEVNKKEVFLPPPCSLSCQKVSSDKKSSNLNSKKKKKNKKAKHEQEEEVKCDSSLAVLAWTRLRSTKLVQEAYEKRMAM